MHFENLAAGNSTLQIGQFCLEYQILSEGLSQGVHVLRICCPNGLTTTLLPTRGMGIEQVDWDGTRFGWNSPLRQPVHPCFVPVGEPSGLGWLDGFTELLVRCGLTSNGAPEFATNGQLRFGLHGRIANLPASNLQFAVPAVGELIIRAQVDEIRFHVNKWRLITTYRFYADSPRIEIEDCVQNLSGERRDFQILYHYNLGEPLLQPGGEIHVPHRRVIPRNDHAARGVQAWDTVSPPQPGGTEQVYFFEPLALNGRCLTALVAADGHRASAIEFSTAELPCFSLWKNLVSEADGYVIGLEPATNYPNPRTFEQENGRTVWLEPGASRTFSLALHFAKTAGDVRQLVDRVKSIQADAKPLIENRPQIDCCSL